jgi:pimeloyl-ACP methyl ester carboxylesterase
MLQEHPESMHDPARTSEGDKWFFADDIRVKAALAAVREAVRQGIDGFRWELIAVWLPWGFRLREIPIRVHVWHGEQDLRVTRADIDFIASKIPDCTVISLPDTGHFGAAKH